MPVTVIVRIISDANGGYTPHNGRYVLHWNPHTKAGVLALDSVRDPALARQFKDPGAVHREWSTVSRAQPTRPWDGKANRPLTVVTAEILPVPPAGGPN